MNRPLRWLALAGALATLWLAAEIIAAWMQQPLTEGGRALSAFPWGRVTLLDLYTGLGLASCWIAVTERSKLAAAAWIAALQLLGNVATLAFVTRRAWRAPTLAAVILPSRA